MPTWTYIGSGAPDAGLGLSGDTYLDQTNNLEYIRGGGGWGAGVPVAGVGAGVEVVSNKDQPSGYAGLDSTGKVPWGSLAGAPANVLDAAYGGIADAAQTTGSMVALSNLLTLTTGAFTADDIGKVVLVGGAAATVNLGATNGGVAVPRPFTAYIGSVALGVASLVTEPGGAVAAPAVTSQTDTAVTCGTNLYDALEAALATGRAVYVPAGDYIHVGDHTATLKRVYGDGHATRIYVSSEFSSFTPTNGTAGLTGASKTLGANAAAGDVSISLSSALATIASGDIIALTSTATWEPGGTDTDAVDTTKGEFCKVQQISGTTVYLETPLADSYTTATAAKIQEFSFADGIDVGAIRFVNATPNVYTYSLASPMALSQYGGFGPLLSIKRFKNVRLHEIELEGLSTAHIYLENCIDFDVNHVKTLDSSRLGSYGYTVSIFASQWGEISHCRARRSSSLINAEGILAGLGIAASMPSRWIEVANCVSYEAAHEPFLTHVTAEYINFTDCRVYGGPTFLPEATHSGGFRIFGRNCKLINPVVESITGKAIAVGGKYCEIHNPIIRNVLPDAAGNSRAISLEGGNPQALGTVIRGVDIDGVHMNGANSEGYGIYIANGCTARIVGRNELRNVDGHGVYDRDATEVTIVDGLDGVSHGNAGWGATPYLLKHDGAGATPVYRNVRLTSVRNAATRVTDKTGAMDNRYQKFTADGTIIIPDGVTKVRCRAVGAGGGGGGAGSAAAAQLQAGGGGAAGGSILDAEIDVVPGETLTIDVGTGGPAGNGGAAGGNAGSDGTAGGNTTVANSTPTTLASAQGGAKGRASTASSTTAGLAGLWGSQNGTTSTQGSASTAGCGSNTTGGSLGGPPMGVVVGGSGGGAATATNGGGSGVAQLNANILAAQSNGGSGASGTSAGGVGTTATKPGCGGGGGGGGAAGTGAGGNGGVGADGQVELWW